MNHALVVLAVAATACLAASAPAGAARATQRCKPFRYGHIVYTVEALGNWSCARAKPWVQKLTRDRVPRTFTTNVKLRNGPHGYHCVATPFSHGGYATGGMCITGTLAYPGNGFAWNPK